MPTFNIDAEYVHLSDATVSLSKYTDGSTALIAEGWVTDDGERYPETETLSVNLSAYDLRPPEGHVYVKDYSEHEGLPAALEAAGIAKRRQTVTFGPYRTRAWLMRVNAGALS